MQLAPNAPAGTSRAVLFTSADPMIAVIAADGTVRATGQGTTSVFAASVVAPLLRARVTVIVQAPRP